MYKQYSIAMNDSLHSKLFTTLIREDGQEDLIFALWSPSEGGIRYSALLNEIIFPEENDRQIHGNVSFNPQYFQRVCRLARLEGKGIAFIHSHPGPGWQWMSLDDRLAEMKMAGAALGMTELPLLGMTIGNDETWSGRFWFHSGQREYTHRWVDSIRVSGHYLRVSHNPANATPEITEYMKRTVSAWDEVTHESLTRLRIGIVGLGSVGSFIAETLARMGFTDVVLIDFDHVEPHNLDRLVGVYREDIGKLKVEVISKHLSKSASCEGMKITAIPKSIVEESGYRGALDCDVLFSCVDRHEPRHVLNHFAYAHLIPVIDGGIQVRKKEESFSGVDWQVQTVGPDRPCLNCLHTYDPNLVSLEKDGLLDDPSYMSGSSVENKGKNENVFVFSSYVGSMEVLQMVELCTNIGGMGYVGTQRFRYIPGIISRDVETNCSSHCHMKNIEGTGDSNYCLFEPDRQQKPEEIESSRKFLQNLIATIRKKDSVMTS